MVSMLASKTIPDIKCWNSIVRACGTKRPGKSTKRAATIQVLASSSREMCAGGCSSGRLT